MDRGLTYIWSAEGWLCVAVVIDLFSRRVTGLTCKYLRLIDDGKHDWELLVWSRRHL